MNEIKVDLYMYDRKKGAYQINGIDSDDEKGWWEIVKNAIMTQPGCKKVDNEFMLIYAVKS